MIEKLEYCKSRKVKSPTRAHVTDAGIDFFVPEDLTPETMEKTFETTGHHLKYTLTQDGFIDEFTLEAGQSILIPSGIHVKVPNGYALIYINKSGVGSKKNLHFGACVIDVGYQGECHINLCNVSNKTTTIKAGEKIIQALLYPIEFSQPTEVASLEELYSDGVSERGTGGFGSTSNK